MSTLQECLRKIALRSASIFGTRMNPTNVRNGNKYARRKLLGPAKLNYYPEEFYISQMYRDMLKKYKNIEIEEDLLLVRKLATMQLSITDILQGKTTTTTQSQTTVTDKSTVPSETTVPGQTTVTGQTTAAPNQTTTEASSTSSEQANGSATSQSAPPLEELAKDRSLFLLPAHPVVYHREARAIQLRARGRGAPKKGQGKRLTLKKK
jgi:hypothetical protein